MISEETISAARKYQEDRFRYDPVGMICDVVCDLEQRLHGEVRRMRDEMFRLSVEIKKLREEMIEMVDMARDERP